MEKVMISKGAWDEYLGLFGPGRTDIYFTEAYTRIYETARQKAECFICKEGASLLVFPYLKQRIEGLGKEYFDIETAYGFAGPIANTSDPVFIKKAFDALKDFAKENNIIAGFARLHPILDNFRICQGHFKVDFNRNTASIDLTVPDIMQNIHTKHRNAIRASEKSGLSFLFDEKLERLDEFAALYRATMERVGAGEYYFFDDGYFDRIRALGDNVVLGAALMGGTMAAAALFFRYNDLGHYHLSASSAEHTALRPNNYLIYRTALKFKEEGLRLFHLGGGTDRKPDNELYRFKQRFSKTSHDFYTAAMIFDADIYGQLCLEWEKKFPGKKEAFKDTVLKYRF